MLTIPIPVNSMWSQFDNYFRNRCRCRISGKKFINECIYDILFHSDTPSVVTDILGRKNPFAVPTEYGLISEFFIPMQNVRIVYPGKVKSFL